MVINTVKYFGIFIDIPVMADLLRSTVIAPCSETLREAVRQTDRQAGSGLSD